MKFLTALYVSIVGFGLGALNDYCVCNLPLKTEEKTLVYVVAASAMIFVATLINMNYIKRNIIQITECEVCKTERQIKETCIDEFIAKRGGKR